MTNTRATSGAATDARGITSNCGWPGADTRARERPVEDDEADELRESGPGEGSTVVTVVAVSGGGELGARNADAASAMGCRRKHCVQSGTRHRIETDGSRGGRVGWCASREWSALKFGLVVGLQLAGLVDVVNPPHENVEQPIDYPPGVCRLLFLPQFSLVGQRKNSGTR